MLYLDEIIHDAIDNNVDISTVLRKMLNLAFQLDNEEIKQWVEHELDGYKNLDDLPSYRKLSVQSYGEFINLAWHIKQQPIPPAAVPSKYVDYITLVYLAEPISYYVSLLEKSAEKDGDLAEKWPHDLILELQNKILSGITLRDAWKQIPKGSIVALIDTVRNRLLKFVLELKRVQGNIHLEDFGDTNDSRSQISQIFNTIVVGNVNNLAPYSQINIYSIEKGNLQSLLTYLSAQGISDGDIKELCKAVDADRGKEGTDRFGDNVTNWLTKMMGKARDGAWKISIATAGGLLAKALAQYFGMA